ncbi:MAG: C40 family peptidase [Tumebacillaceae bacterium]
MKPSGTRIKTFSTLAFLVASLLSFTPANAALSTTATLAQGMSGVQVTELQTDLQSLGFFSYPTITNYFGSVTAQAVKNYQTAYQLPTDGIVGPKTADSINHAMVKKQIVADTYKYTGVKYLWGGVSPTGGFDCSGFVYYMYSTHGVTTMPRTTSAVLFTKGTPVDRAHLEPGDLVFYSLAGNGVVSHVGIYTGNGKFMSALTSKGIYEQSLDSTYWAPKYLGAKRLY